MKLTTYIPFGEQTITSAVGNSRGFGLHFSQGKGLEKYSNLILFYAPVWGGNSGGSLFDENGEVIGVVRAQSKKLISEESYNVAVPMSIIKARLDSALKDKPKS